MESVRVRTRRVTSLILQSTTYPASVTTTMSQDNSNTVLFEMMRHYKEQMEAAIDAAEAAQKHAHEAIQEARLSEAQAQSEALALDAALDGARADANLFMEALRRRNERIEQLHTLAHNVDSHNAQVSLYYKAQLQAKNEKIMELKEMKEHLITKCPCYCNEGRQSGDYTTTPRNSPAAKRCLFGDEVIDLTLDSDSDSDEDMDSGEETETDIEQ